MAQTFTNLLAHVIFAVLAEAGDRLRRTVYLDVIRTDKTRQPQFRIKRDSLSLECGRLVRPGKKGQVAVR